MLPAALVEAGPAALYKRSARDPFGFLFVSANVRRVLGVPAEDILQSPSLWAEAIHPDDRTRVLTHFLASPSSDITLRSIDYRWGLNGNGFKWVRDQRLSTPTSGPDTVLLGAWTDITTWKRSDEALELSRRRLQALFNYSLDGILLTDDDGVFVEANPSACELLGYSRRELLSKTVRDLAPPMYRGYCSNKWDALLRSGEISGDFVLLRADGTTRDFEFRAVAHILPSTHLAILRDISASKRAEREQRRYLGRLEVLAEIDQAILQCVSPSAVAEGALCHIWRLVPCVRASVALFDREAGTASILAVWSCRETAIGPGMVVPFADYTTEADLLESGAQFVPDLERHQRCRKDDMLLAEGVRSYLRAPLRAGGEIIGSLNLSSAEPSAFDDERTAAVHQLADRLAVAMTNARLIERLRTSTDRVAEISKRSLDVHEAERRELARELHDEIGQVLTGLKLRLGVAKKTATEQTREELCEAEQLISDLCDRVRRLSLNLRPPALDALGLLSALLWHFERFTALTRVTVEFTHAGLDRRFSPRVESAAYRIVQESLTNVARHAAINDVRVDVRADDLTLHVGIEDSGRGFDTANVSLQAVGQGLLGMKERVALLGGRWRITSAPASGTRIEADISLS